MTVTTARQELIFLNPIEVATGDRIEINLHSEAIQVRPEGIDWGDREIESFMAQLVMGQIPIDSRWPNRIIKIPLILGASGDFDAARIALQAEESRINEEGGWLKREIIGGSYGEAGDHLFADMVKAMLVLKDDTTVASDGLDPNAELILEALPDFYGDPLEEETFEGTGDASKAIQVKGNLPGRVEQSLLERSGYDQLGVAYAYRCRNYSAAETAQWAYEAEALERLDAAAEIELTGASGGKAIRHNNLGSSWTPVLSTNLKAGTYLTHKGTYDVWVRVYTTSSEPPWLRLLYDVGDIIAPAEKPQVRVPGASGFYLVNLGQITLKTAPYGTHRWQGIIQAYGAKGGENISIDRLYFFCADESSGIATAPVVFPTPLTGYQLRDEFNQSEGNLNGKAVAAAGAVASSPAGKGADSAAVGTVAWTNPENAKVSDNSYATAALLGNEGEQTHYLMLTKMGLSLPVGATPSGVKVEIERHGVRVEDASVKIVKAGAVVGADRATSGEWPGSDGVQVYGSPTDLFGTTLSKGDIEAGNFGVGISVKVPERMKAAEAFVDSVTITVYYTESGSTNWVTSGDAVDLKVISSTHTVQRSEVSDASINQGRYAVAGGTSFGGSMVGIYCKRQASVAGAGEEIRQGALVRYTNEENWLMGCFDWVNTSGSGEDTLRILKRKAGTVTELIPKIAIPANSLATAWRGVWIEANAQGRVMLWATLSESAQPELIAVLFDSDLATGGTLATGKEGFYDAKTGSFGNIREYRGFTGWIPSHDAAIFVGKAAVLSTKGLFRQSADGNGYGPIPYASADLPRIPVSGPEERPVEIAVKVSRGDFGVIPDSGLDNFSVPFAYRPCWSHVPGS